MRRSGSGVPCISHEAEDRIGTDKVSGCEPLRETVEVRVVVGAPSGAQNEDGISAETAGCLSDDHAIRCRAHKSAAPREDVLPLMPAPTRAWRMPCVRHFLDRYAIHGHQENSVRNLRVQPQDLPGKSDALPDRLEQNADEHHRSQNDDPRPNLPHIASDAVGLELDAVNIP